MEKKYVVYQHITPNGMIYTGVTTNLQKRNYQHINNISHPTSLTPYILKYGWDNIKHIVLYENLTREEAFKKEDELIVKTIEQGVCINQVRSGLIKADSKAYDKQWYIENSEKKKTYQRQYYNEHREKYSISRKEYDKKRLSSIEGKIYYRVKDFNRYHPDRKIETPKEARQKYRDYGYIPTYIKTDDLKIFDKSVA